MGGVTGKRECGPPLSSVGPLLIGRLLWPVSLSAARRRGDGVSQRPFARRTSATGGGGWVQTVRCPAPLVVITGSASEASSPPVGAGMTRTREQWARGGRAARASSPTWKVTGGHPGSGFEGPQHPLLACLPEGPAPRARTSPGRGQARRAGGAQAQHGASPIIELRPYQELYQNKELSISIFSRGGIFLQPP